MADLFCPQLSMSEKIQEGDIEFVIKKCDKDKSSVSC